MGLVNIPKTPESRTNIALFVETANDWKDDLDREPDGDTPGFCLLPLVSRLLPRPNKIV
ncbi:MAG: hypothetical protein F6J93_08700 [Oscillatoria sp. SIO1A7]|nr:hypothetical protein [Oscillatoria sp. SIO1A7]